MQPAQPFLQTIYGLRTTEEMVLFGKPVEPLSAELKEIVEFLYTEWEAECLEYPGTPPEFDATAALWGATIIYIATHLVLDRVAEPDQLPGMLPTYSAEITAGAVLSADLCLRFLPDLLPEIEAIDADDPLLPILKNHLATWHYSGIGVETEEPLDFGLLLWNDCARQLYIDRIIARKDLQRAALPATRATVDAVLGERAPYFWKG